MTKLQLSLFGNLPEYSGQVSKHPVYDVWKRMIARCHNRKDPSFLLYGGRGIRVCKAWRQSSRAFVAWAICNGYQRGLQIDRKNNNRGYYPRNCHFVTCRENSNNRRNTVRLSDGTPLANAIRASGLNRKTVHARVYKRGWSLSDALSIPVGGKRPLPDAFQSVGDAAARVVAATLCAKAVSAAFAETGTTPPAGVVVPDSGKGAENAPIDAPALAGDDASTPATALRLSDAAQFPVACDLRAASAHQKGK